MSLHDEGEVARLGLAPELALAAQIRADLLPASLPRVTGYELAVRHRPVGRYGGDYYDVLPVPASNGRLLLCVAHAAGEGQPVALVMTTLRATLRALLGRLASLAELAGEVNSLLVDLTWPVKFVTAVLVDLDPASGAIRWVGAGPQDNVMLRANGDAVPLISTGVPLGLLRPMVPYDEIAHDLAPGDTLVLFSGGVTDAQDAAGEEFGGARLLDELRQASSLPVAALVDRVFAAIDAFTGATPLLADITMLVVRRLPAGQ